MRNLELSDREQPKQLDRDSLVGAILILQQQLAEQQELIRQRTGGPGARQYV